MKTRVAIVRIECVYECWRGLMTYAMLHIRVWVCVQESRNAIEFECGALRFFRTADMKKKNKWIFPSLFHLNVRCTSYCWMDEKNTLFGAVTIRACKFRIDYSIFQFIFLLLLDEVMCCSIWWVRYCAWAWAPPLCLCVLFGIRILFVLLQLHLMHVHRSSTVEIELIMFFLLFLLFSVVIFRSIFETKLMKSEVNVLCVRRHINE